MPLLVKKPVSILDKNLSISWKDLWKGLGKTVAYDRVAKFADIPSDRVEVGAAVGLFDDEGEVAWLLIRRSLGRAFRDLISEHRELFLGGPPEDLTAEAADAGLSIDDEVLELDD